MESLLPILISTLVGGGGGFLGNMLKKNGLGTIGNVLAGAVGGNGLPAIIGALAPTLLGAGADGGTNMIGSVLTSLVGGGVGSLLGGLFKKA